MDKRTGFTYPCNSIKRMAWDYLKCFDHALIMQREDPILPEVLKVYEGQGIRSGADTNKTLGIAFDTELAKAYPPYQLKRGETGKPVDADVPVFFCTSEAYFEFTILEASCIIQYKVFPWTLREK